MPYINVHVQIILKYSYPKIKLLFFSCEIVKLKVKFREKSKETAGPDGLFSFVSARLVEQGVIFAVCTDHVLKLLAGWHWARHTKEGSGGFVCFFDFSFYIGVYLINNVVIVSGGQQRDSIQPYMYMYPFSPKLLSHPGCHITLSRVPCAIQ